MKVCESLSCPRLISDNKAQPLMIMKHVGFARQFLYLVGKMTCREQPPVWCLCFYVDSVNSEMDFLLVVP